MKDNVISRQAAIDALWKALYEYEDKKEKQFQESDELDVDDWFEHRIFVQIMNDIDRQTILNLPSAQPEQRWIPWGNGKFPEESGTYNVTAYDGVTNRVTHAKYQKRLKRWELTGARAYWRVIAWMPLPEPYKEDIERYANIKYTDGYIDGYITGREQTKQRWIPCDERLPEDDTLMLVNYIDERPDAMDIWIGWHEMENVWYIDGEEHSREHGNEVIAWMPLPECYRGEEK